MSESAQSVTRAVVVPLPAVETVPHNLPAHLTSFIGREQELVETTADLAQTRILTLTGAGGCGKSRLAARTAYEVLDRYEHGAWWVELAQLTRRAWFSRH